jgi:hypothetical protein
MWLFTSPFYLNFSNHVNQSFHALFFTTSSKLQSGLMNSLFGNEIWQLQLLY